MGSLIVSGSINFATSARPPPHHFNGYIIPSTAPLIKYGSKKCFGDFLSSPSGPNYLPPVCTGSAIPVPSCPKCQIKNVMNDLWVPISTAKLMATHLDGPCASPHRFLLTTKTPRPKPLSTTKGYQPTSTATNIVVFFSMEHNSLPEVTLSAFDETGRVESSILVLKQRSYIGREPVISSALADTPCAALGVDGVLEKLNATLGTAYNMDLPYVLGKVLNATPQRNHSWTPHSRLPLPVRVFMQEMGYNFVRAKAFMHSMHPVSLRGVLQSYVAQNYDFGKVYAHLRPYWSDFAGSCQPSSLQALKERVERFKFRWVAGWSGGGILKDIPPRRIWDLYANRVVPSWVTPKEPRGISHAWVHKNDRVGVMTPINGNRWPVPMPKDANLDLIRIEMLNLGVEYAWLDVLCLRQEGGKNEYLRGHEWSVDVPTIGRVYYEDRGVVCYFCGLGRPLMFEEGYFESDRCWFNRAWTLQEVPYTRNGGTQTVICGETGVEGRKEKAMRTRFDEQLTSLRHMRDDKSVLAVLSEMQKRVSVNPLDKVAGLAYLIDVAWLAAYNVAQSEEDAWAWLVMAMYPDTRADLFFYYPEPGNGNKYWHPSWKQVMTQTLPSRGEAAAIGSNDLSSFLGLPVDKHHGPRIKSGEVRGLADQSHDEDPRRGELVVKDGTGASHRIKVVANHQYQIPEGWYTLIGNNGKADVFMKYWVVGYQRKRMLRNGFKKLSVIHIEDEDERRKLQNLGVAKRCSIVTLL
ncbi:hypothetical protein EV421DRAFT_2025601 [Armillaria borealis]|uniref:Heterokaryon incompatibility domain-containing protein n=1 Tax=Armillaria borealis TaxID=47425 RepID=A0AA39ISX6_9AGAR|nr:hypothetical protein EV421DRAFT_2025601 [Armillaria borealis]